VGVFGADARLPCGGTPRPPADSGSGLPGAVVRFALSVCACGVVAGGCVCADWVVYSVDLAADGQSVAVGGAVQAHAEVLVLVPGGLFAEPTPPASRLTVTFQAYPAGVVRVDPASARTDRNGVAESSVVGIAPGEVMVMAEVDGVYSAPLVVTVAESAGWSPWHSKRVARRHQ